MVSSLLSICVSMNSITFCHELLVVRSNLRLRRGETEDTQAFLLSVNCAIIQFPVMICVGEACYDAGFQIGGAERLVM